MSSGRIFATWSTEKAKRDFEAGRLAYRHGQPRRMGMPPAWLAGWNQGRADHQQQVYDRLNTERNADFLRNQSAMETARRGAGNRSGTTGGRKPR
jgi:hypothetical protein